MLFDMLSICFKITTKVKESSVCFHSGICVWSLIQATFIVNMLFVLDIIDATKFVYEWSCITSRSLDKQKCVEINSLENKLFSLVTCALRLRR